MRCVQILVLVLVFISCKAEANDAPGTIANKPAAVGNA